VRTRHDDPVIEWLLAGDPAIRWQVMRDLLDEPVETWEAERRQAVESGWIAELLERRGPDGEWPPGRWTASTWTVGEVRVPRVIGLTLGRARTKIRRANCSVGRITRRPSARRVGRLIA
jgi:hypothetical protein